MSRPLRPSRGLKLALCLGFGQQRSPVDMSVLVGLQHVTRYQYDRPVALGPQVIRLRPAPHTRTAIRSYSLKVTPAQHFVNWQQDPQRQLARALRISGKTTEFSIEVDLLADMSVDQSVRLLRRAGARRTIRSSIRANSREELAPYLSTEPAGPAAHRLSAVAAAQPSRTPSTSWSTLNQRLQRDIRYLVRMEPGVQTPEETLTLASGSCRDSAWLLVQVLRHLGLPARFVSGYLIQLTPDMKALDGRPARTRISPICMPGPRSICPAPAGSDSIRHRDCCAARATSRSRRRRTIARRRRSPAASKPAEVEFSFDMKIDAHRRKAARHLSVLR